MRKVGLKNLQKSFQDALMGKNNEVTRFIKPANMTASDRIKVYQDDYFFRLRDSLEEDYPALHFYLGNIFFEEVVRKYLNEFPPDNFSMREVGFNLPKFLNNHHEDHKTTELSEFESKIIESLYSKNIKLLNLCSLKKIPLEKWPGLVFRVQLSLKAIQCHYNTLEYIVSVNASDPCALECLPKPIETLIWRFEGEVYFRGLSEEESALFSYLQEGISFAELCEKMLFFFDEREVVPWVSSLLQVWVNEGIFRDF